MTIKDFVKRVVRAKVRITYTNLFPNCGEQEGNEIRIDLHSRIHPCKIFVHECLHFFYPEWSETTVLYYEGRIWSKLTQKQKEKLYRKMFARRTS